jgi:hypothetical protein
VRSAEAPVTQPPQLNPTIANARAPPTAPHRADFTESVLIVQYLQIGFSTFVEHKEFTQPELVKIDQSTVNIFS